MRMENTGLNSPELQRTSSAPQPYQRMHPQPCGEHRAHHSTTAGQQRRIDRQSGQHVAHTVHQFQARHLGRYVRHDVSCLSRRDQRVCDDRGGIVAASCRLPSKIAVQSMSVYPLRQHHSRPPRGELTTRRRGGGPRNGSAASAVKQAANRAPRGEPTRHAAARSRKPLSGPAAW